MSESAKVVQRVVDAINRVDLEAFADAVSDDFEIDFSNSRSPMSGGRVLQVGGLQSRGHGSGVEVAAQGATVWTVRAGQATAVTLYQSKAEALAATG